MGVSRGTLRSETTSKAMSLIERQRLFEILFANTLVVFLGLTSDAME